MNQNARPSAAVARLYREILDVCACHQVTDIRLFGSVARGEDAAGSDIDFLVHFPDGTSLLDQAQLIEDLSELLGVSVDVVSDGAKDVDELDPVPLAEWLRRVS